MSNHLTWRYRRLRSIAQRVRMSIALRGWRGTVQRVTQGMVRRKVEDDTLALLPLESSFGKLELPRSGEPVVSIIIPVYGKVEYTIACLRSIANHPPATPFEVIVVDDASPDNTASVLRHVVGLRLLSNEKNLGFVGSCNAGAAAARGAMLLFLNNDTQVTPGWADALLRVFDVFPDTGIAGSQLVYPDGRLQEAGAWIFADGTAWNRGRFESRKFPAYQYTRIVDYVSGAALAIRATLFHDVGGFDLRYAPGYYEDADLAFAVRHAGQQVRYVPGSVVVHAEGISSAGEPDEGMKRHQAINQHKLVEKWADVIVRQPAPGTSLAQIDRRSYRGTVLVVDAMTPDASRDSGSLRLITLMALLVADGWHVVFAPDDGQVTDTAMAYLGEQGIEVAARPWCPSVPAWIADHANDLHAAILSRHTVAHQYAPFIRRHAPTARLVFDTVDLHFLREERGAAQAGSVALSRQAQATRKQELELIKSSDTTFVVSDYERALLADILPAARIELLSNIHEVHGRHGGYAGRRDLVFVGGYGHPPNADAMRWMAEAILPALRERWPDVRILVAGDVPTAEREALAALGLDMLGRVEDLAPLMASSLASIAPLRFGAGVKGKVNMAMSHGLPVIGTPVATEGMQLVDGEDVLVAESPAGFVAAYARLVGDEALWLTLSDGGLSNVKAHFSADAARDALRRALS
ncbi:glycosyltransferase [Bacillus sp. NP157]|nr:glycosyltransferase [Bacillus sp. NP157]